MIFLHELGHYLTAKSAGMKVTEFFIGFGPRIWSFPRGETEYGVKAIPAGAYVKIIGMHNLEEVDPADEPPHLPGRSRTGGGCRSALAGSAMHFLIALVCLFVLLAVIGLPGGKLGANPLTDEGWVVEHASRTAAPRTRPGCEPGDRIVSIDGEPVATFDDLREVARRPARRRASRSSSCGTATRSRWSRPSGPRTRDGDRAGLPRRRRRRCRP